MRFEQELRNLINERSMEQGSNTPCFILAKYLVGCLKIFDESIKARDDYNDYEPEIASDTEKIPFESTVGES